MLNFITKVRLKKKSFNSSAVRACGCRVGTDEQGPLKWTDEDMVKFAEGFKNYTDNPTGKEALEIWKDLIELKDSGLDKSFVFNSNDR